MLLRNSLWHLSGNAVPALVALATVPFLIHGLGLEGFGIVTLISSVVGYFGVLDINLSAGSIRYLSHYHAQNDRECFAETFWFGFIFYTVLGFTGCILLFACADPLLAFFFSASEIPIEQTRHALQLAGLGFLLAQWQNYLMIIPQALQRYDRAAQGEAFFGVMVNIVSAVVAMTGSGIAYVIGSRIAVSALHSLWLVWLLSQLDLELRPVWPRRSIATDLTGFSAYAYLSRLASLLHQHADKLLIGAIAGPQALTFYTVPSQLASRILGLTYRLSSVIYPRVSALAAIGESAQLRCMYLDVTRLLTYINFAVLGIIALIGEEFLRRWVGAEFVASSYPVLLLVTLGLLIDSLTNIPSMVNDGLGHPRVTGSFALARGLIGVPLVFIGTECAGILGAAGGHLLASIVISFAFLIYVHGRTVPVSLSDTLRLSWMPGLITGGCALSLMVPLKYWMPENLIGMLTLTVVATLTLITAGFAFVVSFDERNALWSATRRYLPGLR
jgi:O-antigen/teichoic acid export membrane protein